MRSLATRSSLRTATSASCPSKQVSCRCWAETHRHKLPFCSTNPCRPSARRGKVALAASWGARYRHRAPGPRPRLCTQNLSSRCKPWLRGPRKSAAGVPHRLCAGHLCLRRPGRAARRVAASLGVAAAAPVAQPKHRGALPPAARCWTRPRRRPRAARPAPPGWGPLALVVRRWTPRPRPSKTTAASSRTGVQRQRASHQLAAPHGFAWATTPARPHDLWPVACHTSGSPAPAPAAPVQLEASPPCWWGPRGTTVQGADRHAPSTRLPAAFPVARRERPT